MLFSNTDLFMELSATHAVSHPLYAVFKAGKLFHC